MSVARRRRSVLIVDRDDEIRALTSALDAATEGLGRILVIRGTVGIGKTALLDSVAQVSAERDITILRAQASELERHLPFGITLQLFERHLAGLDDATRAGVLSGAAQPAAALFEALPGAVAAASSAVGELPLLHGLYWMLANLGAREPLVLLIDDAHWADRSSLAWLQYLAARLLDLPLLVVVAFRSTQPDSEHDLLAQLAGHEEVGQLTPRLLSREGAALVIGKEHPDADDAFVAACVETAEGWPLLLRVLLSSIAERQIEPTAANAEHVRRIEPRSISQVTHDRLARLGPEATELARAIAVLGREAQLRYAAAIAGLDAGLAAHLADALTHADVLGGAELDFRCAMVGRVIYDGVSVHVRAEMHRRAAELLDVDGAAADRIATHLLRARPDGAPWAVAALRRAASRTVRDGAPASGAELLRRALEEPPPPGERAEILAALADAEAAAGQAAAAGHYEEALALLADPADRGRLVTAQARFLAATGNPREAAREIDAALAALGPEHRALRAELQAIWVSISRTDTGMRAEAAARITGLVDGLSDVPTLAERTVLAHLAREQVFAGEHRDEAVRLARVAFADGRLLEEETSEGVAWVAALSALGWADHLDEYEQGFLAGLADGRRRGSVMAFATCSYALMFSHYYAGKIADTIADAEQALAAERHGWREYVPAARAQLAWAQIEAGNLADADAVLRPLFDDPRWETFPGWGMVIDARGRVALARGNASQAFEDFVAAGELMRQAHLPNPAIVPWASNAAVAAARLGRTEDAQGLSQGELAAARRFGAPRVTGIALRAAGLAARGDDAIDLLRESVAVLEQSPAVLERIRSLTDLGGALRRGGHAREARDPLRQALHLAHSVGATALEHRAHEELVVAGGRPRTPALTGVEALTPSERRVALMAATGMTNRQIAEDLFVTVKAVQWHLHNAYRKLHVNSREELTAAMTSSAPDAFG